MTANDDAKVAKRARASTLSPKRAKGGKRKPPPPPLLDYALDCAVLAVDGAERSGWAIWVRGHLMAYGECDAIGTEPQKVIDAFLHAYEGPHVLVVERPFRIRFGTQTSLGTGERIWRVLAKRSRINRQVRVYPPTWRSKIIRESHGKPRDEARALEHVRAAQIIAQHMGPYAHLQQPLGDESAPAVLLGKFGCFAQQVLAVLPKPKRPKQPKAPRARKAAA